MCFKFDVESLLLQHYFRKPKRLFFLNWSLILLFLFCFCENIRMVKTFKIRAENSNEKWKCLSFFLIYLEKLLFVCFGQYIGVGLRTKCPSKVIDILKARWKCILKVFEHTIWSIQPRLKYWSSVVFFSLKKEYYSKTVLGNAFAEVDVAKK